MTRGIGALALLALTIPAATPGAADAAFELHAESSLTKVWADRDRLQTPVASKLSIALAANEYESTQVIVVPTASDLQHVEVRVSDLRDARSGATIAAREIEVYRVGWVDSGWPDPLLPNAPFDVARGKVQPIWICVHAPAEARAGTYLGTVTVTAVGQAPRELPLTVRVHAFRLPDELPLKTTFLVPFRTADAAMPRESVLQWVDFAVRYKMGVMDLSGIDRPTKPNPDGSWDFSRPNTLFKYAFDRHASAVELDDLGLGAADLPPEWKRQFVSFHRALAANMKRHGWWDKCYIKTADEPKYDAESARKLRVIADLIHEADPDYKILLTVNVPVKDATWAGVTDYWCPLINFIPMPLGDSPLAKVVSEAKSRGGEMWTYTCCWPPPPWVNVAFIEEDAMAHRALPLMCMRYGAAGYLYWGMKWWPPENFADKDWHGARKPLWPLQPWHSRLGELPAGDGYIAYPDGRGGPLPSIRAMLFRDGVEDCQYVKLLERRGKRPALETMFPDGCHYPSAAELLRWRREAARVVEGR